MNRLTFIGLLLIISGACNLILAILMTWADIQAVQIPQYVQIILYTVGLPGYLIYFLFGTASLMVFGAIGSVIIFLGVLLFLSYRSVPARRIETRRDR